MKSRAECHQTLSSQVGCVHEINIYEALSTTIVYAGKMCASTPAKKKKKVHARGTHANYKMLLSLVILILWV